MKRQYIDEVIIRETTPADAAAWESMRRELWPDEGAEDHAPEIAMFLDGHCFKTLAAALVAESRSGAIVGFAELSIREDLPGLEGKRVGYVEGLYVRQEVRHTGIARKLLRASQSWARAQKCVAFASDRAERIIVDGRFTLSE